MEDTPERSANAKRQHELLGLDPYMRYLYAKRFTKEQGGGVAGCRNSHTLCIMRALRQRPKLKRAWIQEDDFIWTKEAITVLSRLSNFLQQYPNFNPDMIKLYGFIPQTMALQSKIKSPPLLERTFSHSTLGYIISRKFMKQYIRQNINSYNCHVDWAFGRMSDNIFLLQPSPMQYNSKLESNIQWGSTIASLIAQDMYQKVLDQGSVERMLYRFNNLQQKLGLYQPSSIIRFMDKMQPDHPERDRFLKDVAIEIKRYDQIYKTHKGNKQNVQTVLYGGRNQINSKQNRDVSQQHGTNYDNVVCVWYDK